MYSLTRPVRESGTLHGIVRPLIWHWLIAGEPGVDDSDQWRLSKISCPGWRRSILVHSTWYSWWWQVRRECSVDAVNEKPLGKLTEAKWICVCICVCCLWAVQVLKHSVTRSPCAVEIIVDTSVELKHRCLSPPCPWNFPEKVCGFDLKLASGGNKWKAATIYPWFSGPVQTFKCEKPWPSGCAVLPPAGWHPVLASWIRAAEQEAKSAWPQLFVWLKLKPCSLSLRNVS